MSLSSTASVVAWPGAGEDLAGEGAHFISSRVSLRGEPGLSEPTTMVAWVLQVTLRVSQDSAHLP